MSTRQDTILCRKIMEKKIFLFLSERCKCNLGVLIKYFWPPLFSPIVYLLFDISTCGARAGETHNRAALGAAISWYQGPDIGVMTLSHSQSSDTSSDALLRRVSLASSCTFRSSRNLSDGNEWLVPAWEYCHSWADPGLSGCGASGSGDIGVSESGGHVMAWHQSQHGNNVTRVSRRLSHHITSWEQRYWSHLISQNAMKRLTVKHKVSVLLLVWSLKCFLNLNVEVSTNW